MYYPCSENKDADLRLCFRPCKLLVFSRTGSIIRYLFSECALFHIFCKSTKCTYFKMMVLQVAQAD